MTPDSNYDVIIIGTDAGGGTLAHRLAPTGKRILLQVYYVIGCATKLCVVEHLQGRLA